MSQRKKRRYARGAPSKPLPAEHAVNLLGHEVGNVLNGLLGMAGLLRDSGLDVEQESWLRAIEQSGRQMALLIESAGSGVAEGHVVGDSADSPVDGLELLELVLYSHFPASRERNNRLLLVVDPGLERFWRVDARCLRQLLDNLLDNANKHTRDGDVVLEARRSTGGTLLLEVCDTGPGIDHGLRRRLFEPYRRGNGGAGRQFADQGLGLYVCREIAAGLGGRIECVAGRVTGACLRLTLPGITRSEHVPELPRPSLFDRLACRLEFDGVLRRSVGGFLTRLGVHWTGGGQGTDRPERSIVRLTELRRPAAPGLELCLPVGGNGVIRQRIDAPVLLSRLAPALLEMAFEGLNRDGIAGSPRRPRGSAPPGARDSRPG